MDRREFLYGLAGARFAADEGVEQVLVMFKCHLDVGFVDTQAAIIKRYFTQFYPQAIAIAISRHFMRFQNANQGCQLFGFEVTRQELHRSNPVSDVAPWVGDYDFPGRRM